MTTEHERLLDALAEYESIYGTRTYTGNKDRDEEYAKLKQMVKDSAAKQKRS